MTRFLSVLIVFVVIFGGRALRAAAAEVPSESNGYSVVSWDQKDGLPAGIVYSIAQDSAGYLWLAMDDGVIRFDGFQFTDWAEVSGDGLPPAQARALRAAPDGSLWVGFAYPGGVSRIKDAEVRNYGEPDGLPRSALVTIASDHDGTIWAGTEAGLYQLRGERWHAATPDEMQPHAGVASLYVNREGDLLVGLASGVYQRRAGGTSFTRVQTARRASPGQDRPRGITEDWAGRLWVTDPVSGFSIIGATDSWAEHGRGMELFTDSRREVWVATFGEGLWRVRPSKIGGPRVERIGLVGSVARNVTSLFEDRERNIWAGLVDGLVRLSPHKVTPLTNLGIVTSVQATQDGAVWVGTYDEGVLEFLANGRLERKHLAGSRVRALHADTRGVVWVGTDRAVFGLRHGTSPVLLRGSERLAQVESITSDSRGDVWIYDLEAGLFRWDGKQLLAAPLPTELRNARIVMYGDRNGQVWIAFDDGQNSSVVIRDAEGRFEFLGSKHNLPPGAYRTIYEDARGAVWVSGFNNLIGRFVDKQFHPQMGKLDNGRAIIEDESGRLWISAGPGIMAVDKDELDAAYRDGRAFEYESFDELDGVAGTSTGFLFGDQNVARAADGRLWFVTGAGITVVDPRAIRTTAFSPRPRIDYAAADGQMVAAPATFELRPGLVKLEIFYGALNLTSPHKTRFKYRLEGFDSGWVDAGPRRQVVYTNLPPRSYRFHVMATAGDSATESAAWQFYIRPAFYQRRWFWPLCVALLAAGTAGAWWVHLRRVHNQFVVVLEERARLSREIHDTLLQGLVGVALQFDIIGHDLKEPQSKARLERIRNELERYVREARQAIWDLRSLTLEQRDLVSALREACEETAARVSATCDFSIVGTPRPCSSHLTEQLLHIAREAMANAARHAQPNHITVTLEFAEPSVILRIADDGRGFDPTSVTADSKHFGLVTMRERTGTISGSFHLESTKGRGTTVVVVAPHTET